MCIFWKLVGLRIMGIMVLLKRRVYEKEDSCISSIIKFIHTTTLYFSDVSVVRSITCSDLTRLNGYL